MRFPRSSGILLHPSSLPGPFGSGDLGEAAFHFVDWLNVAGQKHWQILPLGPVGMGYSPYMSPSAFAGNPLLIDPKELASHGWLNEQDLHSHSKFSTTSVKYEVVVPFRMNLLRQASAAFFSKKKSPDHSQFLKFCTEQKFWLEDYALFMALMEKHGGKEWSDWDKDLGNRKPSALKKASDDLRTEIQFWEFVQWSFFRQWFSLKKYANERGVQIIGDIPIFVAYQSADTWARPELFYLDKDNRPTVIAGVPPDYFSETGQRWGNPLYRWNVMDKQKYSWWIDRIKQTLSMVDIVRIDHFRGFAGYWEIPATEKTAVHGKWIDGPREKLFDAIVKKLGKLPIIAEDLGVMTPDVLELRDRYNFPGMRVLQFAFAGDATNPFLPHNYTPNTIVYTGTHDNDTTRGWFGAATEREKSFVIKYLNTTGKDAHLDLIRAASASVADIAIYPFQDVLGLGTEARMNFPGTPSGNWAWRFSWDQVESVHADRLYQITALSNRCCMEKPVLPPYPAGKATP